MRMQHNNKQTHKRRAELDFAHMCLPVYTALAPPRDRMRNPELNTACWACARNRGYACSLCVKQQKQTQQK